MTTDKKTEGRLASPPLPYLDAHKTELVPETAGHIHAFDEAHVVMLCETGIIPPDAARLLLGGLARMEADGVIAARQAIGGGNHAAERYLAALLGPDIGGLIGVARSSGDLSAVSIRSFLRETALILAGGLCGLREALVARAGTHTRTVMPANTHGQHGQPTTFAHWCLMAEAGLARATARLLEFRARANRSPAGACIMTGTDFPIDPARTAALLGFDGVLENTMDAVLSHDLELEFAGHLLTLTHTLSRLADDLMLWSTFEYGMVELPDWFCGTSSIMPQKKNPDGLEDLKGLHARALAAAAAIAMVEKGPTGYPIIERRGSDTLLRDLSTDLAARLEALPRLVTDLIVNADRMEDLAGANWAQATDLAALLVRTGKLSWRQAHHAVARFIRHCLAAGLAPRAASLNDLRAANTDLDTALAEADFADALDVTRFVERRTGPGSPSAHAVAKAIRTCTERLATDRHTIEDLAEALSRARSALAAAKSAILA